MKMNNNILMLIFGHPIPSSISFKVIGHVSNYFVNPKLEVPITIGTYPISDEPSKEGEVKGGGYKFPVSAGPIVQQPSAGPRMPSASGPEPTDPLLPKNENVSDASHPSAGSSTSAAGPSMTPAAPPKPSAPFPESGKII